tara:strand:- start:6971 stop:7138 length:168 start_codon:yes stop_codon:yes gene_type:complete
MYSTKAIAQDAKVESGLMYYLIKYIEWFTIKKMKYFVIDLIGSSDIVHFKIFSNK